MNLSLSLKMKMIYSVNLQFLILISNIKSSINDYIYNREKELQSIEI